MEPAIPRLTEQDLARAAGVSAAGSLIWKVT